MLLTVCNEAPSGTLGTLEVDLSDIKDHNPYSRFRILPTSNSKKIGNFNFIIKKLHFFMKGDKIFDSDLVRLQETKEKAFYINVETDYEGTERPSSLDVNACEVSTAFKIKAY